MKRLRATARLRTPGVSVSDLLLEDRETNLFEKTPPPGAGAFDSGHRDTAEKAEELLAEDFGER